MALVLWTLGIMPFQKNADAANLTSISDTLSDSSPTIGANHTLVFTVPNGVYTGQTIVINFPAGFAVGAFDFNDVDVNVGASNITLAASPSGTTWGVSTTSSSITLTTSSSSGATVASSSVVTVKLGTNTAFQSVGTHKVANPSSYGSYELTVNGTMVDNGQTRVAIVQNVLVTANVDTSFTFTVTGVANGATVNGSPTTTATTTTATSVPFGTLAPNVSKTLAQDLTVTTNAINGFVVTVQQTQDLLSSTGATIDGFANGAYTNTPTAWVSPTNILANNKTWGHWGITSEDDLNASEFSSNKWVAASTTPRQIFQNSGVADGATANVGKTRIGFQAQIASLQEAADDYNTTLIYIATPTF
jgi:hypothetical protein